MKIEYAEEMRHHWKEIDYDTFMNDFVGVSDLVPTAAEETAFNNKIQNVNTSSTSEKVLYPTLCDAIQVALGRERLSVKDTSEWEESQRADAKQKGKGKNCVDEEASKESGEESIKTSERTRLRIDLSIYKTGKKDPFAEQFREFHSPKQSTSSKDPPSNPSDRAPGPSSSRDNPKRPDVSPLTPLTLYDLSEEEKLAKLSARHTPNPLYALRLRYAARMSWPNVVTFGEIKPANVPAAFDFSTTKPKTKNLDTDGSVIAKGQIFHYVAEILRRQHREFLFFFYIRGSRARLVRSDRLGSLVTKAFDYTSEPQKLHHFLYRIGRMNDAQLGFDMSVAVAGLDDVRAMRAHVAPQPYLRDYLNSAMKEGQPIYKVSVGNRWEKKEQVKSGNDKPYEVEVARGTAYYPPPSLEDQAHTENNPSLDPSPYTFLIGRPLAASHSPIGRGTRGFVAYSRKQDRLIFLKDVWRLDNPDVHPELEIYSELHRHAVECIATPICGGDVILPDSEIPQRTITQKYLDMSFYGRIHYRFALSEIGRPLSEYLHSYELIWLILCAFIAHQQAWTRAAIMHRDVSATNIVIVEEGGRRIALLIDWDLSKHASQLQKKPTQLYRSGTWMFMSALLQKFPKKQYELSDDLESFIHIINIFALRFHRHDITHPDLLSSHLHDVYEAAVLDPKGIFHVVNNQKFLNISRGTPGFQLLENNCLATVISSLMSLFQDHYSRIDMVDMEKNFGLPSQEPAKASTPQPVSLPEEPLLHTPSSRAETTKRLDAMLLPTLVTPKHKFLTDPVLDHSMMKEILWSATEQRSFLDKATLNWIQDSPKTADQFENLVGQGPLKSSFFSSTRDSIITSSNTSSKRGVDEIEASEDGQSESMSKRLRESEGVDADDSF